MGNLSVVGIRRIVEGIHQAPVVVDAAGNLLELVGGNHRIVVGLGNRRKAAEGLAGDIRSVVRTEGALGLADSAVEAVVQLRHLSQGREVALSSYK